jgi:hypothetical protein
MTKEFKLFAIAGSMLAMLASGALAAASPDEASAAKGGKHAEQSAGANTTTGVPSEHRGQNSQDQAAANGGENLNASNRKHNRHSNTSNESADFNGHVRGRAYAYSSGADVDVHRHHHRYSYAYGSSGPDVDIFRRYHRHHTYSYNEPEIDIYRHHHHRRVYGYYNGPDIDIYRRYHRHYVYGSNEPEIYRHHHIYGHYNGPDTYIRRYRNYGYSYNEPGVSIHSHRHIYGYNESASLSGHYRSHAAGGVAEEQAKTGVRLKSNKNTSGNVTAEGGAGKGHANAGANADVNLKQGSRYIGGSANLQGSKKATPQGG